MNDEELSAKLEEHGANLSLADTGVAMSVGLVEIGVLMTKASERLYALSAHVALLKASLAQAEREAEKPAASAEPVAHRPTEAAVREACEILERIKVAHASWGGWSGTPSNCDSAINLLRYRDSSGAANQPAESAETEPFAYGWRHVANEWADELCNALQGVRNIDDGTQPSSEVAGAIQRGIRRCRCRDLSVGLPVDVAPHTDRVAELTAEVAELQALCDRQYALLNGVALAIRGEEPPLTKWSHHDLPDRAKAAMAALALALESDLQRKAEVERLRGWLAMLIDLYEDGSPCYSDPDNDGDFLGYAIHIDEQPFNEICAYLDVARDAKDSAAPAPITSATCDVLDPEKKTEYAQEDFETLADEIARLTEVNKKKVAERDALTAEVERLRGAITTAVATIDRDGDEWGICDHLRAALPWKEAQS